MKIYGMMIAFLMHIKSVFVYFSLTLSMNPIVDSKINDNTSLQWKIHGNDY